MYIRLVSYTVRFSWTVARIFANGKLPWRSLFICYGQSDKIHFFPKKKKKQKIIDPYLGALEQGQNRPVSHEEKIFLRTM